MTPNPILTVLSTLKEHRVKSLLIGGQACIIYGAAEFSRDSDFVIFSSTKNLMRLKEALNELGAELIYVPPLQRRYLKKGHACHFRCNREDVKGLRIDILSKLRGCSSFHKLWERKNTISLKDGNIIDVISLQDLVQSKKTQREKDWFMLKRLVNNDIMMCEFQAPEGHILWWFQECRNATLLIKLRKKYPDIAKGHIKLRPLLKLTTSSNVELLNKALHNERELEIKKDRKYWMPLRKELEVLRHNR